MMFFQIVNSTKIVNTKMLFCNKGAAKFIFRSTEDLHSCIALTTVSQVSDGAARAQAARRSHHCWSFISRHDEPRAAGAVPFRLTDVHARLQAHQRIASSRE